MARPPRPLVLLAALACVWVFLRGVGRAAEVDLLPVQPLWGMVLVETLIALAVLETGRDLPPWRRGWLAGTLLLTTLTLAVYVHTNQEAMHKLLRTGAREDLHYPPVTSVLWVGEAAWVLTCALLANWLWALRHRIAAVAWTLAAGLLLLHLLDACFEFLPWHGVRPDAWPPATLWFNRSLAAVPAVAFLLLGGVLVRRELGPRTPEAEPTGAPQARAGVLAACAVGAAILVGYRAALPFPVVPISLAAAAGVWIAYAAAGWKPGWRRVAGRFTAGVALFLLLSEGAHRGAEQFARRWFLEQLTTYPDAMTILLFLTASFAVVLLVGAVWRIARPGSDPSHPSWP